MTNEVESADYLTLAEVAERRGLHYMTVYRHVRTGRLPAIKENGEWKVRVADLDGKPQRANRGKPGNADIGQRLPALQDRLLAADEPGAWGIIENCLSAGAEPVQLHHQLIIPVLQQIGDSWSDGELGVVDEHTATAITYRLVSRLGPLMRAKGRPRGTIVLGAVAGDPHSLTVSIVADLLRAARFNVIDLGGNTPIESFVESIRGADQCRAVGISTSSRADDPVRDTVRAIKAAHGDLPVLLGGSGIKNAEHAKLLGSDGYARTSTDIVPLFETSIEDRSDVHPSGIT
ncbi:MAG: cobalamin-dependent protein [Acidimicrobiales bacterium]